MNHQERRWLLHEVVEQLEPHAHSAAVSDHVRQHHCLDLPLVRIYVDLERLVANGYLLRHKRIGPSGGGATFYWETTGKVRVEPDRPKPKAGAAEATLHYEMRQLPAAVASVQNSQPEAALLPETV